MFLKRIIISFLLLTVGFITYGQSDIFLTQQWFSRINMNPAATGSSDNVNVFLLNRQQWVGFANAPQTSVLNAHSYFNSIQSGLGFSLIYDKLGISHQTVDAMFSYAYHIDLTDEMLLSLGLAGGLFNNSWNPRANTFSDTEPVGFYEEKSSRTAADFHTGFELRGYGGTVGASVTHLLNSSPERAYSGKPGREINVYARYRTMINQNIEIAPGIMYRNANHSHFFDVNVTGFYQKKYWAGLSLRPKKSFAAMMGFEYNMFRIGYAYDRSVGAVSSLSANTHEFMLSVRIQKPQQGRKTTRFLD